MTVRTVSHSQVASVGKGTFVSTYGGIHAQLLAIFQTEWDSGLHYRLVDAGVRRWKARWKASCLGAGWLSKSVKVCRV